MVCFHVFIISTFPLAVPLEWNVAVHLRDRVPVPRASELGRLRSGRHGPGAAGGDRRRAAVLPGPGQPAAGPGVVPALDAPVRRQLGVRPCGRSRPARRSSSTSTWSSRPRCRRTSSPTSTASGGGGRHAPDARLAGDAQPGPGLNSIMINQLGADIDTYTLREAEFACNCDRRLQLRRRPPARPPSHRVDPGALRVRAGRVHRRVDRVRAGRHRAASATRSSTPPSASSSAAPTGRRRGRRAAVAAERADPDRPWTLPHARLRAASATRRGRSADRQLGRGGGMTTRGRRRQRAQRARCRAHPRRPRRRGDGARGRRRARRRHPQQRADPAGPDPRRVLGFHPLAVDTPFSRRFDLARARADLALAGGAVRPPARRRRGRRGLRSVERDRRRPRQRRPALAAAVRPARPSASTRSPPTSCARCCACPTHPLALARFGLLAACRHRCWPRASSDRRRGRCWRASPRTRSGRSRRRCPRRSGSRSAPPRTPTAGRSPRAARRRSARAMVALLEEHGGEGR